MTPDTEPSSPAKPDSVSQQAPANDGRTEANSPSSPTAAETEWLTEAEQEMWRSVIGGTRRLLDRLGSDLKVHGLTHDDYAVLVNLSEAPEGRLRMSEVADSTAVSRSRLSHHMNRMERQGWVDRQACPEDRRGAWAVITPAGQAMVESVAPVHVASVRRFLVDLLSPKEVATLGSVFSRVETELRSTDPR